MVVPLHTPLSRWPIFAAMIAAPAVLVAASRLETVRKSADEWVRLRVENSRLESAWKEERSLVEALAASLEERAAALEAKRDLTQAKTARDREEFETLRTKRDAEAGDLRAMDTGLQDLSARLLRLRPSLPPRLSDALELSYRSLAQPGLPPADRMQFAMNILNRCQQFNRTITVSEDVVSLAQETETRSLPVIYWGLSHGYAVDHHAREAWWGAPIDGSWQWERKPGAYENAARLIAIAQDRSDPDLIAVPAQVARVAAETAKR